MNTESTKKELKTKYIVIDVGESYAQNIPSIAPISEAVSLKNAALKLIEAVNNSIIEKKAFGKRFAIYFSYTSSCANCTISATKEMISSLYDEIMRKRYNSVTICEGKKGNPRRYAIVKVK